MSKITSDGLTRSGTGCFIAVSIATVGVKGLNPERFGALCEICEMHEALPPTHDSEVGSGLRSGEFGGHSSYSACYWSHIDIGLAQLSLMSR